MNRRPRKTSCRGFLIVDVMMALALLGITVVILVSAVSRTDRAVDRLSDSRNAGRVAEEVLIDLEAGLPIPTGDAQTKITVEACEGGAKVAGRRWVQVVVTYQRESRLLVGLVPESTSVRPASPTGGEK